MDFNNEFPDDVGSTTTSFDLIFTVIAFLAAGFSAYTTFIGFYFDFTFLPAFIIALIIGLALLIINFRIRDARRDGESVFPALTAFFLILIFSFISNTNAFYTFFLERDGSKNTQVSAWKVFDEGTTIILSHIEKYKMNSNHKKMKETFDNELYNFERQVMDINNPGVGFKAKGHLDNIQNLLGTTLTKFKRPAQGSSADAYEGYVGQIKKLAVDQFNTKYAKGNIKNLLLLEKEINESYAKHKTYAQTKKAHETAEDKLHNSSETDRMKQDLISFKARAKEIISFNVPIPDIDNVSDDFGSFQYTWTNFSNGLNKAAMTLSILLSLMLDILTPLISILLYRRKVEF